MFVVYGYHRLATHTSSELPVEPATTAHQSQLPDTV